MKKIPYESAARRVCIVVDNLHPRTGWGRLANELGEGLTRRNWEVAYISQSGSGDLPALITPMRNFSFRLLPEFIRSVRRIRKFIKDYNIVFCFDANPYGIIISIAAIGLGKTVIIDALGTYSLFTASRWRNTLIAWTYRQASTVFIVSDFVRKQIEKSGFRFRQYELVPVGVDAKRFQRKESREGRPYIISVGGIKWRKGYHFSVPAFAQIANLYPALRYIIVGKAEQDTYAANLHQMIEDAGLSDRIIFKPDVTDEELVELYSGAELFVLTSVTDPAFVEGFGMVYLEAGACELPVVGARDSGASAAIVDGVTGLLVEHNSADIARGMSDLLDNPDRRRAMGKAGAVHAREFSWERIVDMHVAQFERFIK